MEQSINFAEVLERVFTHPNLFETQSAWAKFLDVSRQAVTQFKRGEAVPSAKNLRLIRDHLNIALPPTDPIRQTFEVAIHLNLAEIGIKSSRLRGYATLEQYLVLPVRDAFDLVLALLDPVRKEQVLLEATQSAWKKVGEQDREADEVMSSLQ